MNKTSAGTSCWASAGCAEKHAMTSHCCVQCDSCTPLSISFWRLHTALCRHSCSMQQVHSRCAYTTVYDMSQLKLLTLMMLSAAAFSSSSCIFACCSWVRSS